MISPVFEQAVGAGDGFNNRSTRLTFPIYSGDFFQSNQFAERVFKIHAFQEKRAEAFGTPAAEVFQGQYEGQVFFHSLDDFRVITEHFELKGFGDMLGFFDFFTDRCLFTTAFCQGFIVGEIG